LKQDVKPCDICGRPTTSRCGVCATNPDCRKINQRRRNGLSDYPDNVSPCDICGDPTTSIYRVCVTKTECRKVRLRRRYGLSDYPENCAVCGNGPLKRGMHCRRSQACRQASNRTCRAAIRSTIEGWARRTSTSLRDRDSSSDITFIDLMERYQLCEGRCERADCDAQLELGPGRPVKGEYSRSPSVDKIYSDQGYRQWNFRLLCSRHNWLKQSMTSTEMYAMAQDTEEAERDADKRRSVLGSSRVSDD
jgi:hypothetical protein